MGWIVGHGWWSFSHFRDFSFLLAFSSKMFECSSCRNYSARIAWLWQSIIFHVFMRSLKQWADTSWWGSSLHQLHELEMLTMLCTKMLWQQRWRQCRCGDGVAERMVGGKGGGTGRGVHMRHLCCWPVVTPLSRQPESSTVHAIGVCHFVIKMCQFITMLLLNAWIILHHHSQNPCTVVAARDTLEHLELSAGRMEMSPSWRKDHPLALNCHLTYCHYGVKYVTFLLSIVRIISQMFNKISKAEFHPHQMCRLSIKRNNCCYKGCPSFFFNNLSKIWIINLVTTMTCVDHIITRGLSIIMGSWTNLTAQPHSRRTNLLFPFLIPLSTAPLGPICHSSFPAICCAIACLKCMLTNVLFRPSLESFVGTSRQGG